MRLHSSGIRTSDDDEGRAWGGIPLTEKIAGAISSSLSGILADAL
jgi:hypothetical protein